MKTRIKQFLRKPSPVAIDVPPQHIPAKQLHYGNTSVNSKSTARPIPSFARTASDGTGYDERSRVTSWTNSATTHNSRTQSAMEYSGHVSEYGMLQRSASGHSLRTRSSFFGRSVQNKLRKTSRPDLAGSKSSHGLYAALQNLIQSSSKNGEPDLHDLTTEAQSGRYRADTGKLISTTRNTIRSVTPALNNTAQLQMSPVIEIVSPGSASKIDIGSVSTIAPVHAPSMGSSPERLAARARKAYERWQDALEPVESSCYDTHINPYELSVIEKHMITEPAARQNYSPENALASNDARLACSALSPSIYSRASDGSTRMATPEQLTRTSVTVTGREVRSYQISPPKIDRIASSEQPIKVSSEWRRWLSGELRDFSNALSITKIDAAGPALSTSSPLQPESSTSSKSVNSMGTSQAPASDGQPVCRNKQRSRPLASDRRRSSFMNERYPTIESSRSSSRHSGQSREVVNAMPRSIAKEQPMTGPSAIASRHKSVADMISALRSQSALSSNGKTSLETDHTGPTVGNTEPPAEARRPQSNAELRARFRSNLSENARPLGIQRKKSANVLQMPNDDTLRRISAGPYASLDGENTPPTDMLPEQLPALSSSQWLASSNAKPSDGLAASVNASTKGKTPSPGQRLAAGWLKGRSPADNSHGAAFV